MKMGGNKYNNGFKLGRILGDEDNTTVEFWGDDNLIASQVVKSRDLPKEFSVDLTGIKKFEIRIADGIRYPVDFAEVKLK